jgi:hypothetical protein
LNTYKVISEINPTCHRQNVQEFKKNFVGIEKKLYKAGNVLEIIKDHDLTLKKKIEHFFHSSPESDKGIKTR